MKNEFIQQLARYRAILCPLIVVIVAGYLLFSTASELYAIEMSRGGRGYVSDEVWYASSSRNILLEIFGLEPRQVGTYGATIVFKEAIMYRYMIRLLANETGVSVKMDYTKINAIYVNGSRDNVKRFIELISERLSVQDIVPGWELPDHTGINDYLNLEHPPVGKYIIGLSMLLVGDYPLGWRLPLIIAGVATALLVYMIILELTRNHFVSLVGGILFSLDTMTRSVFSIALLDGFVAFLTTLSLYLAIRKKYTHAILVALFSGTIKFTGLFTLIPLALIVAWETCRRMGLKRLSDYTWMTLRTMFLSAVIFVLLLFLVSTPLIIRLGLIGWVDRSIIFPLRWHLTAKCIGQNCPISSAPWDWIIGYGSFPLYYYPDDRALVAESYYPLWFTSYVASLIFLPIIYKGYRRYAIIIAFLLGVFSGYILIWMLGGRTQYSFYAVQLSPLVYIHLFYLIGLIGIDRNIGNIVLVTWSSAFRKIVDTLERIMLLRD